MQRRFAYAVLSVLAFGCGDDGASPTAPATSSADSSSVSSSSTGAGGCELGDTYACYNGPPGTEGVGICRGGVDGCGDFGVLCAGEQLPQPENCVTPEDEDCDGESPPCTGDLLASFELDATTAEVYGMAFDAEGALYATGYLEGSLAFAGDVLTSAGQGDLFAVKFAPDTTPAEGIRIGGVGHEGGLSLDATPTTGFAITGRADETVDLATTVTGDPPYDTFIGLFASSMEIRWARGLTGGPTTYVREVSVNGSGSVVVVGYFEGTSIDLGAGTAVATGRDSYVARYAESTPALVWQKIVATGGITQTENVSLDEAGNVFFSLYTDQPATLDGVAIPLGRSVVKLNDAGVAQWAAGTGATTVLADEQGGAYYTSQYGLFHLDASGTETLFAPGSAYLVTRDPFGNLVFLEDVAGVTHLIKLTPEGQGVFDRELDVHIVRALDIDATGRIAISGRADAAQLTSTIQWFAP